MARNDAHRRTGAAMTASGAVVGGTGLIAGGVPGAREPDAMNIWNIRGRARKYRKLDLKSPDQRQTRSRLSPPNLGHNAKTLSPQPRAGILGFRASMHQAYIDETKNKPRGTAYVEGMRRGKLSSEAKIVRGMRKARRATYPITIGGGALALAGHRRMTHGSVTKFQSKRKHGALVGTSGAVGGAATGAYLGLRGGAEAGVGLVNRNIKRAHVPGSYFSPGDRFVRRKAGLARGAYTGIALGTTALGAAGYRLSRGKKTAVDKRDKRSGAGYSAAMAGGGTVGAIGHFAPVGLDRFERKYANSSIAHVQAAQTLAPHFGGVRMSPPKVNEFGVVTRPSRATIHPERSDEELRRGNAASKIRNSKIRAEVGRHRGIATQEKHFAEAFRGTSRVVRHVRGPGLALAGAGATGLVASRQTRVKKDLVWRDRQTSTSRLAGEAVGAGAVLVGGSRIGAVGSTLRRGRKSPNARVRTLAAYAERARSATELKTQPIAAHAGVLVHRSKGVGGLVDLVPARLRPTLVAGAGAALLRRSHPARHDTYRPVARTPMQGGW